MANKVLQVDYAQMEKLAQSLSEAGRTLADTWEQMCADVEELGEGPKAWVGPNHDAFVTYFEECGRDMDAFARRSGSVGNYLEGMGVWVADALALYKKLEADVDAKVREKLSTRSL